MRSLASSMVTLRFHVFSSCSFAEKPVDMAISLMRECSTAISAGFATSTSTLSLRWASCAIMVFSKTKESYPAFLSRLISEDAWSDNFPVSVRSRLLAADVAFLGNSAFSTRVFLSSNAATPKGNWTMNVFMLFAPIN